MSNRRRDTTRISAALNSQEHHMTHKPNSSDGLDPLVVWGEAATAASDPSLSDAERAANESLSNLIADHYKNESQQGNA
ncbi:hypothetical protein ACH41E_02970 [Streptomyces sp. NPDC020412]|uniref:hypothetical protein n=1 Tax=Streptomyces sp. NPDC020412 TaxID=3365073 RepID=UPI0037A6C854